MAESLRSLLGRSLEVLRREQPEHFEGVRRAAAGLVVEIDGGDERFGVRFGEGAFGGIEIVDGEQERQAGVIRVRTRREAVVELVEGVADLREQLRSGRLEVFGPLRGLGRLDEALRWYLHGALRSQEHRDLYLRLRGGCQ